ncbi:UPF0149 family protein [Legionella oakridgensis]|uniref:YecA family protein n=2 Tax=Legionella oakridgensis TaxID=29423 RepID=W0BAF1_9GAMM|nr:YecA family protein [Legionella oakridgensis]AHE65676.1 yecA family protein [Legionella oakridgensis ATCC 33761 = DSM 21215]ETO94490.1 yecA family protein [Legionella oakridgensis RV-2-2007]KTD38246.1 hypothetical protein Loak_1922 [Legionella oakridgensis]STY15624.1 Putative conserved exported protein precursor [Legionella longbeachae]
MTGLNTSLRLPDYQTFIDSVAMLAVPFSGSELHGIMCGYLCAGATGSGEAYLRALTINQNDAQKRMAMLALFDAYAASQQQITGFDFEFQLMLPNDDESLMARAQAFSEWCEGFTQGLTMAGVDFNQFQEEEVQEAAQHLVEFAQLDYEALQVNEEDERALMEVSEYARMAVLRIYHDLQHQGLNKDTSTTTH